MARGPSLRHVTVPGDARALVRADEYLDELMRELSLIRMGREAPANGTGEAARLLTLIDDVLSRYARPRRRMREQAQAAMARGDATVFIELDLPLQAAATAERFLQLLDEAYVFASQGRLLTLPPPPEVLADYYEWVEDLVGQLRNPDACPATGPRRLLHTPTEPVPRLDDPRGQRRLLLQPDAGAPRRARQWVRSTLTEWGAGAVAEAVSLPATELVTNAVLYAATPICLVLALGPDSVRLEVQDESPLLPAPQRHDVDSGTGRGLDIVAAVTDRWGIDPRPGGKAVWFETALHADARR